MKNYSIEKIRTVSTIMVIVIHSTTFINSSGQATALNYYIYRRMSDFGVVFFFAVSGYFIASKNDSEWTKRKFLSGIGLYFFATASHLLIKLFTVIFDKLTIGTSIKQGLLAIVSKFSLVGLLNGEMVQTVLWYLPASAIAYLIYYYFQKNKIKDLSIIVFVLFVYSILSFSNFDLTALLPYGGFAKGLVAMTVGYLAYRRGGNYRLSLPISIISLFVGAVISLVSYSSLIIFIMISVYFALCYCKFNPSEKSIISEVSKNSLSIYLFHIVWINYVTKVFHYFGFELMNYKFFFVVTCVVVSYLLSPALYRTLRWFFSKMTETILSEKKIL